MLVDLTLPPVEEDEYGFTRLNCGSFLNVLANRAEKIIKTADLIRFFDTLGRNKSGSNNNIGRCKYFLNAFSVEIPLVEANPDKLQFIGDDHLSFIRGATGTDDPDLYLFDNGNTYTIEVKTYWSIESYFKNRPTTNFHNADYCLAFILKSKQWVFSKRSEYYSVLYTSDDAMLDSCLKTIKLPNKITTISFFVPNCSSSEFDQLTDDMVPETVYYTFYENHVTEAI